MSTDPLAALRGRTGAMLDDLGELVTLESPSADLEAVSRCVAATADLGRRLLGSVPEYVTSGDRTHLRWTFGSRIDVLLVGHVDTVWPLGTTARWPFAVADGRATGPGVFDMKAGVVQLFNALAEVAGLDSVAVLITTDEEIGSPTSRALVERSARGARGALILEASAGGALKVARKGVSKYRVTVTGRAAHAGLEPEKGVNAGVELARQVLTIRDLSRPRLGTTVTPTTMAAGTVLNTVPAHGSVDVDVRAATREEQMRVDAALRMLAAQDPQASVQVTGAPNRPPLEAAASADLFSRAQRIAARLGLADLRGVAVGGGSDGNLTAGIGVPTLDGLGAVGDHAHAEGEYVEVAAMAERAALVAALVDDLRRDGEGAR
jgi:glutamate carboxypeptidase